MRRYATAAEAVDHYYSLRECPVPARDVAVESQFARGEPRTEPYGMDDLIALSQALDALNRRCPAPKVAVWLHVRYFRATHREACAAHNARVKEAIMEEGTRDPDLWMCRKQRSIYASVDFIRASTVGGWLDDVDRRFEQLLADAGLLIRNAVNLAGVEHEPV